MGREGGDLYSLGPALLYSFISPVCMSPRRTCPSPLASMTLHMLFWKAIPFLVFALNTYSFFSIPMRFTSF